MFDIFSYSLKFWTRHVPASEWKSRFIFLDTLNGNLVNPNSSPLQRPQWQKCCGKNDTFKPSHCFSAQWISVSSQFTFIRIAMDHDYCVFNFFHKNLYTNFFYFIKTLWTFFCRLKLLNKKTTHVSRGM